MAIVVEPPPIKQDDDAPPRTKTRRRRHWWRWRFPWIKTAVSAPVDDEPLLIVNATDEAWALSLSYRDLGIVRSHEHRAVYVVRTGILQARRADAPGDEGYLTLPITHRTQAVQIACRVLDGEALYSLWPVERVQPPPRRLEGTAWT